MVQLPSYYGGNSLDFSPVQNALSQVTAQNNANRQYGLEQQQSARADQQLAIQKQSADIAAQDAMVRQSAGLAQAALGEKDPVKKATIMSQLYSMHPEYKDKLAAHGINPNDFDGTANFIVAQAKGYINPQDAQLKNAQIALAEAEAAKARMEGQMSGAQLEFLRDPSRLFEVPGMPGGTTPAPQPSAPGGTPPQNSLSVPPPLSGNGSSALPDFGGGMRANALSIAPGKTPQGLPTSPAAGTSTPASGAVMPSMGQTPAYFSPEDAAIARLAFISPRAASAMEQSPGHVQRKAQA